MFCKAYNPGNVPCTRHGGFRGSNTCDDHYHYNKTMCTICKNPILNPKLLTCGHIFCMTCVHEMSRNSVNEVNNSVFVAPVKECRRHLIQCPTCEKYTYMEYVDTDMFCKNIKTLLDECERLKTGQLKRGCLLHIFDEVVKYNTMVSLTVNFYETLYYKAYEAASMDNRFEKYVSIFRVLFYNVSDSETHETPELRRSTRVKKPIERLSL